MKVAKLVFALLLVCLMTTLAQAQGRQGRGQGGGFNMTSGTAQLNRLIAAVKRLDGITDDQKTQADALAKEYASAFKDLDAKREKIYTPEQIAARDEAMKKVQDAQGADRRAAFQAVRDAIKPTDDQQKALTAVTAEVTAKVKEVRGKVDAFLTEDQKTALTAAMNRRGRGNGGNGGQRRNNNNAAPTT